MILKTVLKRLLSERGVSVTRLAKATSIPQQTLHNWLSGSEPRSLNQVKKVANYLGVTLDYLCFGYEQKQSPNIETYADEINAGIFEVVLRKVKK